MHPIGPELPISAHVACARVCQQLYVLCASHALVQATVGVGTVIIVYIGVAYTKGVGGTPWESIQRSLECPLPVLPLDQPHPWSGVWWVGVVRAAVLCSGPSGPKIVRLGRGFEAASSPVWGRHSSPSALETSAVQFTVTVRPGVSKEDGERLVRQPGGRGMGHGDRPFVVLVMGHPLDMP